MDKGVANFRMHDDILDPISNMVQYALRIFQLVGELYIGPHQTDDVDHDIVGSQMVNIEIEFRGRLGDVVRRWQNIVGPPMMSEFWEVDLVSTQTSKKRVGDEESREPQEWAPSILS